MKILTIPHSTLRQVCPVITSPNQKLKRILTDLQNTLLHSELGVGLAAPQIGQNLRVFGINLPKSANNETPIYRYFINPSITNHPQKIVVGSDPSGKKADLEGCLSIPHIYTPVARFPWIEIEYQQLENGQLVTYHEKLVDYAARVFQHEADHLDGVLFVDHALRQRQPFYLEKENDELERITAEDFLAMYSDF